MKEWVDAQFDEGRVTVISDAELEALVAKFAPDRF